MIPVEPPTTVADLLREGAEALPPTDGLPNPIREAGWLLSRAMGVDEAWLKIHPEAPVSDDVIASYRLWLLRRAAGEPAHHLTGRCSFWGRSFEVSPAVLVPRPETELLVQVVLELPAADAARVVDVGTGSGAIAITLAAERRRWRVAAVDRSAAALQVARRNAERHDVSVPMWLGDLTSAVDSPLDLVVANLPYVPSDRLAGLSREGGHDPGAALDGGPDGLDAVRRLLGDVPRLLRPCGGVVLELGEDQAEGVAEIAHDWGLAVARRIRDLAGCDRVVVLQRGR